MINSARALIFWCCLMPCIVRAHAAPTLSTLLYQQQDVLKQSSHLSAHTPKRSSTRIPLTSKVPSVLSTLVHATPQIAQDFLLYAALALAVNVRAIHTILWPNPNKLDVGALEDLAPAQRHLFEQAAKKLALDPQTITIKQCSELIKNRGNDGCAAGMSLLLVDKSEALLPPEEFSFLVAHELAHLKTKDTPKKMAVSLLSYISGILISYRPLQKCLPKVSSISTQLGALIGCYFFSQWLSNLTTKKYSCYQEKQADLTAVAGLGSKQGALNFLKRCQQSNLAARASNLRQGQTLEETGVDEAGNNLFDTEHPLLSERIAYINAALPN